MTDAPEHTTPMSLFGRCYNARHISYPNYGARGIGVCARWNDFATFLADVGPRPGPEYSIERIDNNADYGPGNCRWATRDEQNNNKRSNRTITFQGRTMGITQWARETGLDRTLIRDRLEAGWSVEASLTTPPVVGRNQYTE